MKIDEIDPAEFHLDWCATYSGPPGGFSCDCNAAKIIAALVEVARNRFVCHLYV